MSKKMFLVLIGIVSLMLSIVLIEFTGLSVLDAYLTSRGLNISITVDGIPPDVVIISPENTSYSSENVLLNYSVTDSLTPISTIWYNLNNGTNTTVTAPGTINAPEDTHILYLYANDTAGNMNSSYISFNTTKAPTPPPPPSDEPSGRVGPFKEEENVTNVTIPPEEVPPEEIPSEEVLPGVEDIQEIISEVEFDKVRVYLGVSLIIFLILLLYIYMRNNHGFLLVGKRRREAEEVKRNEIKKNYKKGFLLGVILLILLLLLVSNAYAFESFTVDPPLIVERLAPGQIKPTVIRVTNIIDEEITVNVTKEKYLEEFTHVNLKQIIIPPNETRSVYLEFYSTLDVSQRVEGNISFIIDRRGIKPEIKHTKVILDIQKIKEENVVIKGLDEYDVIKPGDEIKITFDVGRDFMNYNFSSEISYFLLDSNENIIWSDEDLFNEYSKNISVTLRIPGYISDGDYKLKINVKVLGKLVNTATKDIKVEGIKAELRNYISYLLAIVAMLVIVIVVELFKRKLKMEKELFLF